MLPLQEPRVQSLAREAGMLHRAARGKRGSRQAESELQNYVQDLGTGLCYCHLKV